MTNADFYVANCHWCARPLKKFDLNWWDSHGLEWCEENPVSFDFHTKSPTGKSVRHQSDLEVHNLMVSLATPAKRISDNVIYMAQTAPRTSKAAAKKALPRSGTMRRKIYEAILNNSMTDFELETLFRGKHESISAGRRSLVVDGFLQDSGKVRKNSVGNECVVWQIAFKETLFG